MSSWRSRARDEDGFTIVEAMVAAFILTIGLVSSIGVFDHSRDQSATAERNEIGLMQAEAALEEIRGVPYSKIALSNAVAPPDPANRVSADNTTFQVRPDLSEEMVYALPDATVLDGMSTSVAVGPEGHPVDITVHRYVTWRDEECRVLDLSSLGLSNLDESINSVQVPLEANLNGLINSVISLLSSALEPPGLAALETRLKAFRDQLAGHEAQFGAIAGVTELDLCDISLTALSNLQKVGTLTPSLSSTPAGDLTDYLTTLQGLLPQCVLILGCPSGTNTAITNINNELNCVFGSSTDTSAEFDAYFDGVVAGLNELPGDLADTNRNTKRITVAVAVEPRTGVGPFEPVWASTVVQPPGAGLLSSSGVTTC
jgi:type II secretory pathway pseudopilin PulG